jgi:hypothetical protein
MKKDYWSLFLASCIGSRKNIPSQITIPGPSQILNKSCIEIPSWLIPIRIQAASSLAASSTPKLTGSKPTSPPPCRLDVILNAKWNKQFLIKSNMIQLQSAR